MINPNDLREILFKISKEIILPSFGNLKKNQISYKDGKDIVIYVWYDNEFGYTKQVIRLAKQISKVRRLTYY